MVSSLGSGCGGSGIGSSTDATEFCYSMVDEMVDAIARCFAGSMFDWRDQYTGSMLCDQVDGLLAAGRLTYDRASGADCLTQLSQLACSIQYSLPESCTDALAGNLPAGSQCSYFENGLFSDCASGNYCSDIGNVCGGICKPFVQPGGSCAYTDGRGFPICASGSSCQFNGYLCVPYLGESQPCGAGDCGDDLYCDLGTTVTCQKRKTSGTCTYGYECAAGYVCTGSAYAKTCTKVKLPGDSCTQGQSECYGLSFCGDNGKCTRTGVGENQPCGTNPKGEYIQCGTDLYCDRAAAAQSSAVFGFSTCQRQQPTGSNCSYSLQCAGISAYCDSATSLCATCAGSTATSGATGMGGADGGSDIPASTGGARATGG